MPLDSKAANPMRPIATGPSSAGADYREELDCADGSQSVGRPLPMADSAGRGELAEAEVDAIDGAVTVSARSRLARLLESRRTPALLTSLTLHLLVLLVLALLTVTQPFASPGPAALSVSIRAAADRDQDSVELELTGQAEPALPSELEHESTPVAEHQRDQVQPPDLAPLLRGEGSPAPAANYDALLQRLQSLSAMRLSTRFVPTGIEGRRSDQRAALALQRGGSAASERAVEAALEWLAAHQLPSGGWSLQHHVGDCNGRCANPGSPERFNPAATGLALLAFLGAGYSHREGKYQQQVQRGIYYLKQVMEESPQGTSFEFASDQGMYNHGIAAFALCEAYQLTKDPDLQPIAQQVINYIVVAQNYEGGWGYRPKQPGDLTISGWQSLALKSAAAAGLEVPPSTIQRISNFLETQMASDQRTYFYRVPQDRSMACTAIGILLRMFLGESPTAPRLDDGLRLVAAHNDYGRDIYFRYYAALALFHCGGGRWEAWNQQCRDYLIATQATQGHEAGSWYFEDHYGKVGGRLYTTAMAAMTLEVYYRYSPLYQQADQPFEL